MYKNAGKSLKNIISVVATVEMLISIIIGICIVVFFAQFDSAGLGFLIAAIVVGAGCFNAWLKRLELYAFGEIADCVKWMRDTQFGRESEKSCEQDPVANAVSIPKDSWKCCSCGTVNPDWRVHCPKCSTAKSWSVEKTGEK